MILGGLVCVGCFSFDWKIPSLVSDNGHLGVRSFRLEILTPKHHMLADCCQRVYSLIKYCWQIGDRLLSDAFLSR